MKKVVVTRQLIDDAQQLLNAKSDELEIVQWDSEKASHVLGTQMTEWLTRKRLPSLVIDHGFSSMSKARQDCW